MRLPTSKDVQTFVSRTCSLLRQLLAAAVAAAPFRADWLLRHRPTTALTVAAGRRADDEAALLLQELLRKMAMGPPAAAVGALPDAKDLVGALEVAIARGNGQAVRALLAAGADGWGLMAQRIRRAAMRTQRMRRGRTSRWACCSAPRRRHARPLLLCGWRRGAVPLP